MTAISLRLRDLATTSGTPMARRGVLALLIVAAAACVPTGGVPAIAVVVLGAGVVLLVASRVARPEDALFVATVSVAAFLARDALVGGVDAILSATGRSRIVAPDELIYFNSAARLAAHWHDPGAAFESTDPYAPSQYVQTIARVFFVTGPSYLPIKLINTLLEVLSGLLLYRMVVNFRYPHARSVLVLMLVFPSLALWSGLGLKDSYVLFFELVAIWAATEFVRSGNYRWHAVTAAALVPIVSVRLYVFVVIAVAWLGVVVAAPHARRLRTALLVVPTVAIMLILADPIGQLGGWSTNLAYLPIIIRQYAAVGARTGFTDPLPVALGAPGDRVVVSIPGQTPDPNATARVIQAPIGTDLVPEGTIPQSPERAHVFVRSGDIIVISEDPGSAGGSPRPSSAPITAVVQTGNRNTIGSEAKVEEESGSFGASVREDLKYLPTGVFQTIAAPLPWNARTLADVATIPEMLLWYAIFALAVVGFAVLVRARDLRFAPGVLCLLGLVFIFSLIQSNGGTLIRSRMMMIPLAIVLAAVGFEAVSREWERRRAAPRTDGATGR
jgi:hypothetical protein